MAILSVNTNVPGMTGVVPSLIYIQTNDTLATVVVPGYINQFVQREGFNFNATQTAFVTTTDSGNIICNIKVSSSGVITLLPSVPGLSSLLLISGTLTSAQILGMHVTPVTLIPAPGAGYMILVNKALIELVKGDAAFANGGETYLQYGVIGDSGYYAVIPVVVGFVQSAVSAAASLEGLITDNLGANDGLSTLICGNSPISITNGTGAFTTGTGSFRYYIWYSIVSIS